MSVSHSFSTITYPDETLSWFHFLCKNIEVRRDPTRPGQVAVNNREAWLKGEDSPLPQADYTYHRSGFFLRAQADKSATLVCFGATPEVKHRLEEFVQAGAWSDALNEPNILLDIVLDGIFLEVDKTVWSMRSVFGPIEHVSRDRPSP
jgi:hypothetical protein